MGRPNALVAVGRRNHLRIELLRRFVDSPPDVGQNRVMQAGLDLVHQNQSRRARKR